jgi:hypothetical protein
MFGSVVTVTFQSVFRVEMYQNDVFFFLKLFLRSAHQKDPKHKKKLAKKNEFFENVVHGALSLLHCKKL